MQMNSKKRADEVAVRVVGMGEEGYSNEEQEDQIGKGSDNVGKEKVGEAGEVEVGKVSEKGQVKLARNK